VSSQYFRFNALGAERRRSLLLEQLLARGDPHSAESEWRAEGFALIAPAGVPMPSVAAAALRSDRELVDAAWVCVATPVHYVAEMTRVRLPEDGILSLTQAAAQVLAADFNRVWAGSAVRLTAAVSGQLFCLFDRSLSVTTRDPVEVLGQSIEDFLPLGEDAATLRRLISETEMWLFEHGVNRSRGAENLQVVNGLWFWGGGAPLSALPRLQGWVGGDDVFFSAFGARQQPGPGSGVVTCSCEPSGAGWQEMESRWLRPAVDRLRRGGLSRLEISALDRRFTVTSMNSRRFWRRRKPWWEELG
jgi:hypothetical protein